MAGDLVPAYVEGERLLLTSFASRTIAAFHISEMPHSMPPEDMLKSLAIHGAREVDRPPHLNEMMRASLLRRQLLSNPGW